MCVPLDVSIEMSKCATPIGGTEAPVVRKEVKTKRI